MMEFGYFGAPTMVAFLAALAALTATAGAPPAVHSSVAVATASSGGQTLDLLGNLPFIRERAAPGGQGATLSPK
jgi:hypothetical protein